MNYSLALILVTALFATDPIDREAVYQEEQKIVNRITEAGIGQNATVEILPLVPEDDGTICLENVHNKIFEIDERLWTTTGENAAPQCDQGTKQWPRIRSLIRLKNCTNITLRPVAGREMGLIQGPNATGGWKDDGDCKGGAYEAQHGIQVVGSKNIRIENLDISNVYGDFIYVNRSSNVWIDNVKGHHNCRQGIAVVNANHVLIENSDLFEIRRSSIDLENNGKKQQIEDIVIRNNKFGRSRFSTLTAGGGGDVRRVFFHDNKLYDEPFAAYLKGNRNNDREQFYFYNNTSDAPMGVIRGGHISGHGIVKKIYAFDNQITSQKNRNMHTFSMDEGCEDIRFENNTLENGTDGVRIKRRQGRKKQ